MQDKNENAIFEFKKLMRRIISTDFYKALQKSYLPRIKNYSFQSDLPNWEAASHAFTLFRQFLLKGDVTSIMNYGEHLQKVGDAGDYKRYENLVNEFENYLNYSLGFYLHRSTERNNASTFYEKELKVKDVIDEMFYGGNGLFHGLYDQHGHKKKHAIQKPIEFSGKVDENRLYEFFLALMTIVCRMSMIITLDDFDDISFCKEHCPYRIYFGDQSLYDNSNHCEAIPIAPRAFRTFSLFNTHT
ncbi:MAG: hypothetical protein JW891_00830 [Candidatus Lokiarchaeota archaeon]|nr:hypothetical protein [Candidatus Lokiarchaeota archaeon]